MLGTDEFNQQYAHGNDGPGSLLIGLILCILLNWFLAKNVTKKLTDVNLKKEYKKYHWTLIWLGPISTYFLVINFLMYLSMEIWGFIKPSYYREYAIEQFTDEKLTQMGIDISDPQIIQMRN